MEEVQYKADQMVDFAPVTGFFEECEMLQWLSHNMRRIGSKTVRTAIEYKTQGKRLNNKPRKGELT